MIKLLEERLRQEVALAVGRLERVGMTGEREAVLLKFNEPLSPEQVHALAGILLSGYYSEKSTLGQYDRFEDLHIDEPAVTREPFYSTDKTYVLAGNVLRAARKKRQFVNVYLCFFDVRASHLAPRWDYVVIFSRRRNNLEETQFRKDHGLTVREAYGFLDYISAQKASLPATEAAVPS